MSIYFGSHLKYCPNNHSVCKELGEDLDKRKYSEKSQFGPFGNLQNATCEKEKHQTTLLPIAITASGAPQDLLFLLDAQMLKSSSWSPAGRLIGWKGFQIQMVIS